MPANGNAGWIDEAIATWGDSGYLPSEKGARERSEHGRRDRPMTEPPAGLRTGWGAGFWRIRTMTRRERRGPKRGLKSFLR